MLDPARGRGSDPLATQAGVQACDAVTRCVEYGCKHNLSTHASKTASTYMNDFKNLITILVHETTLFQICSELVPNNFEAADYVEALQTCGRGHAGDNRAYLKKKSSRFVPNQF